MIYKFEATGTVWQIKFFSNVPYNNFIVLREKIKITIEKYDRIYSRFNQDSVLNALNRYKVIISPPFDFFESVFMAKKIMLITQHAFTPFIGRYLQDIGYDEKLSFSIKENIEYDNKKLGQFLKLSKAEIRISSGSILDLSSFAKGIIIDKVREVILAEGYNNFIINAGGDIIVETDNNNKFCFKIEDPLDSNKFVKEIDLHKGALCSSSNNKRCWTDILTGKDYFHIKINGKINYNGVSVVAGEAYLADLLATCILITGAKYIDQFRSLFNFKYYIY